MEQTNGAARTAEPAAVSIDVAWLGHATTDIRLGDISTGDARSGTGRRVDRFVTDPVLRDRCAHLRRHRGTSDLEDASSIDAVLISHLHHDHLDLPSLRRLPTATPCIVPAGAEPLLRRTGLDVLGMAIGDDVRIGHTHITVVPAEHRPNRFASTRRADAVGFVLTRGDRTVYFPGDTDLHPAMSDLPRPDVALLPIWGWGSHIGPGHLDPHRAAQAAAMLDARVVLPVHWGTFAPIGLRRREPRWFDAPARRLEHALATESPGSALHLVPPGPERHLFSSGRSPLAG